MGDMQVGLMRPDTFRYCNACSGLLELLRRIPVDKYHLEQKGLQLNSSCPLDKLCSQMFRPAAHTGLLHM